ncbi:MAG: hypothetical protein LBR29_00855, partial [Methylobacteriaceae bacterium]|nr:hypothetical protein [Methylobacteriaceae bacterium]
EAADAGAGEWETDGRNITFRYDGAILCTLPFDAARRHRTVHWFSPVTESLYLQGADYPAALSPALLAGNIRMDLFNVLVDKGESDEQAFIGAIREFPLEFMAVESIGVLSEHGDDAVASEAETPVEPPAPEPEPPAVPVRRDGGTFARIAEDVSEAFQLIGCLSIVITLFLVVVVSLVLIRLLGLSDFLSILIFIILGF